MSQKIKQELPKIQNTSERKITLRFRNQSSMEIFDFLKKYCDDKNANLHNYIISIVETHVKNLMMNKLVPDLAKTIYSNARQATFDGSSGINTHVATLLLPVVTEMEVLDRKLNLMINAMFGNIDKSKFKDLQRPPDLYLEEYDKFKDIRNHVENKFRKNIDKYKKRNQSSLVNHSKMVDSISIEEFVSVDVDEKK